MAFVGRLHDAERERVGGSKDRGIVDGFGEQLPAQLIAMGDRGCVRGVLHHDGLDPCALERFGKSGKTQPVRDAGGAVSQIQDVAMPQRKQVFGGEPAAGLIVHADRVDLRAVLCGRRAEQHGGQGGGILLHPVDRIVARTGKDDAVHLMAEQEAEQLLGYFGVVETVAQHDIVAQTARMRLHAQG